MAGALADLLVLELGMAIAVPYATMLLGDLGARVIKIEERGNAELRMARGPIRVVNGERQTVNVGNYRDRNKESVILNLKGAAGREAFLGLIRKADVLIENFSVGTMERLGLGYRVLQQENPRLIMASVSSYGQTGPDAHQRGYDILAQARAGFMSVTGFPDAPPTKAGTSISDYYGGLTCAVGILGALHYRERTGRGQYVDVALMDALLTAMEGYSDDYLISGNVRTRSGNSHPGAAGYAVHPTVDGHVVLALLTQAIFERFCRMIGQPELLHNPMLATPPARREYSDLVDSIVGEWVAEQTNDQIVATCVAHGVPAAKVQDVGEVARDPQVLARQMIVELPHPEFGSVPLTGTALKLSETPGTVRTLAPKAGQHTASNLRELLGYSDEQIAAVQGE